MLLWLTSKVTDKEMCFPTITETYYYVDRSKTDHFFTADLICSLSIPVSTESERKGVWKV